MTGTFVWPRRVSLVESKSTDLDFKSLGKLRSQFNILADNQALYDVIVSVGGLVKARLPLTVVTPQNGAAVLPFGVGPLDAFPAQLEYRAVKGIVVKRRKR